MNTQRRRRDGKSIAVLLCLGAIAASPNTWAGSIVVESRDSTEMLSFTDASAFSDASISGTTSFNIAGNAGDTLSLGFTEPHGSTSVATSVSGSFTLAAGAPIIASPNDTYPLNVTATGTPSVGGLVISSNLGVNVAPSGAVATLNNGISGGFHYLDESYNPTANQTSGATFSYTVDIAGNYSGSGVGAGLHQLESLNSNWAVTQNFVFNGTDTVFSATVNDYNPAIDQIGLEYRIYGAPAPVPLPAACWLLLGGLGGLAAFRPKKATR